MKITLDLDNGPDRLLYQALRGMEIGGDLPGVRDSFQIDLSVDGFEVSYIEISGFGPHGTGNEIDLDKGLTLIEGPNGSGKTHVIHSLYWALFGRTGNLDPWTMDQIKDDDLINWNLSRTGGMKVIVEFAADGKNYRVIRSFSNNGKLFKLLEKTGESWKICRKDDPLDPYLAPMLLYQGENPMFLSSSDPFSDNGMLFRVIRTVTGAGRLERGGEVLQREREITLETLKDKGERAGHIENEIERLKTSENELISQMKESRKKMEKLMDLNRRAMDSYSRLIGEISGDDKSEKDVKNRTGIATRIGRLEERLSSAWSRAYVEILRKQGKRSLEKAVSFREESTRKRIMFGVHEAQQSIVEEILERRTCICGTPIGTSGMGRERLKHVLKNLEEKKKEVSDWGKGQIWSSDRMIGKASLELMTEGSDGKTILEMLEEMQELRGSIMDSGKRDERSRLIEAVRKHERTKILIGEEKSRLQKNEKRIQSVRSEIDRLRTELGDLMGSGHGSSGLKQRLKDMDDSIKKAGILSREIMDSIRSDLEIKSTEILRIISDDENLGIKIHPEKMTIGRQKRESEKVIPLERLSAGERQSVVFAIICAFSGLTVGGLIMDSPFNGMQSDTIERSMQILSKEERRILILIPSGTLGEVPSEINRYVLSPGPEGTALKEVNI
jgi:DNA repair exonuclease SbcCD ATPase subunit